MMTTLPPYSEKVWTRKADYDRAEKLYYEKLAKLQKGFNDTKKHKNNHEFRNETPKNKGTNINTIPEIPQVLLKVEDAAPKQNGLVKTDATQNSDGSPLITEIIELTIKNKTTSTTTNNKETNNKVKKERKKKLKKGAPQTVNTLAGEVAKAREHIKNSMQCIDNVTSMTSNLMVSGGANKLQNMETEHNQLKQKVNDMSQVIVKLEQRIAQLEKEIAVKCTISTGSQHSPSPKAPTNTPSKPSKPQDDEADDGVDLFASDSEEEDAEAAKIKEQRLAEYNAKKSKKPVLIAKSNIILDVKPWDDETDMKKMEEEVRSVTTDGLVWGASKLVPLAYGIHKLQISCVVEDDKVSVDWLQETIQEKEEYVQSVDIAAFNKV